MRSEDIQALISHRLQRAEESLHAAEIMLHNQMFTFAMNRIYYAMFYAVQATLVLSRVSFSKHGQVKAFLNRELIKTGILPIELGRLYNKAFEYRQKFDYVDFAEADPALVDTYLKDAREFVAAITVHIQKKSGIEG
jgi:uncharacterized protein (UPF0332 family)